MEHQNIFNVLDGNFEFLSVEEKVLETGMTTDSVTK
jgi:hypothetical protein